MGNPDDIPEIITWWGEPVVRYYKRYGCVSERAPEPLASADDLAGVVVGLIGEIESLRDAARRRFNCVFGSLGRKAFEDPADAHRGDG